MKSTKFTEFILGTFCKIVRSWVILLLPLSTILLHGTLLYNLSQLQASAKPPPFITVQRFRLSLYQYLQQYLNKTGKTVVKSAPNSVK
jgi:hypothetical protein